MTELTTVKRARLMKQQRSGAVAVTVQLLEMRLTGAVWTGHWSLRLWQQSPDWAALFDCVTLQTVERTDLDDMGTETR